MSRWRPMPRSARTCGAARAARRVRRAPWARRGRSGCCGWSGDLCEHAGHGGFPGVADHAGPDRAATCRDGVAPGHRTRGCASGVDAGHARGSVRVRRLAGVESCRERDAAGRPVLLLSVGLADLAERSTACTRRELGLAALSTISSSAESRPNSRRQPRGQPESSAGARRVGFGGVGGLGRLRSRASGWPFPGTTGSGQSAARRPEVNTIIGKRSISG